MGLFNFIKDRCAECATTKSDLTLFKNKLLCFPCLIKCYEESGGGDGERKESGNWNELVTPQTLEEFIGQEVIKKEVRTMLQASKIHGIPVQHCLFSGNFGLGKTTIAKIFAKMIGEYSIVTATSIKGIEDFPQTNVVVIDEIHAIGNEEWLLSIMDSGEQTILGATTTAGSLSGPLRSRFVSLVLEPYRVEDLEIMVKGAANRLNYDCSSHIANEVAIRGKQIARVALFLFKRVYDRIVLDNNNVSVESLAQWFNEMQIDSDGLENADRAYLSCLSEKPVGLQYLSAMTGLDKITLEETVEPYLLNRGYVMRTPRGRLIGNRQPIKVW